MKKKINFSGVQPDTWARTIVLLLALINQVLAILGKGQIEIAENDIYQVCTLAATIISSVWSWWKNNSFSDSAQSGDAVMHTIESAQEYQPPVDTVDHTKEG